STNSLDVQLPAAASSGGAYITLTSGTVKYFGALFIDNADNIPAVNGCTYDLNPSGVSARSAAGSVQILVVTQAGCSYQATSGNSFVHTGGSLTGTGVVSLTLDANSGPARTATVEIAGQPVSLTQAALLPVIRSVQDAWSYTPGIAPGAWVTISGEN